MAPDSYFQYATAAESPATVRGAFIRRTYLHLAGAILLFGLLETILITAGFGEWFITLISGSRYSWLMVLGAFAITGWIATRLATSDVSVGIQYLGLGLYIVAEAIIFVPLIFIAMHFTAPEVLPTAAILTLVLFAGLTGVAFTSGKDFSFLGSFLILGGFIALGLIVCSVLFGFNLGLIFSGFMIILAGAAILYDTSKVIRDYPPDKHVGAALQLFASVALLFFYVLRLLMALNRR